ncbi:hypothetical protein EVAR_68383_1 [Eumeta japonica]|uniref:Uncharacterized protein n=1 Tax=Eumeta variegata TaxID=151549 RepID=A0A4C1ZRL2_EUMVA|nr:hypothetical protein EVAR_68383_1 [Eumeta japonica]
MPHNEEGMNEFAIYQCVKVVVDRLPFAERRVGTAFCARAASLNARSSLIATRVTRLQQSHIRKFFTCLFVKLLTWLSRFEVNLYSAWTVL